MSIAGRGNEGYTGLMAGFLAAALLVAAAFAQETDYVPPASELPRLIREVRHGDWKTRIHAVHTLGRMGAVEGLSVGITDGDWQIRLTAVHWLGRQGDAGVPALERTLRTEPCKLIRLAAIHWLGSIGPSAIPALKESLDEASPTVRLTTAYWLKKLGVGADPSQDFEPPSIDDPGLLAGATHEELRGCDSVNWPPRRVVPMLGAEAAVAVAPAAAPPAQSPETADVTDPTWVEEELPQERPTPKPKEPAKAKAAEPKKERTEALKLLAESPEPAEEQEEAEPSKGPENAKPVELARGPSPAKPPESLPPAATIPKTPPLKAAAEPSPASLTAHTAPQPKLGSRPRGTPERLPPNQTWHLVHGEGDNIDLALKEPDPKQPDHDPVPDLIEALGSANWRLRYRAADLLGVMGPQAKPAVDALIDALKDKHAQVRSSAALALGNVGGGADKAVPALKKALRDRSMDVRYSAAIALGRIGTPSATRAFQKHMRSEAARMIDAN